MKVFNIENNKKILYVQLRDIKILKKGFEDSIPESIKKEIFVYLNQANNNTLNDFIRFDNEDVINFYNSIDWIIDYGEFLRKSTCLKEFELRQAKQRLSLVSSVIDLASKEELEQNPSFLLEYKKASYKLKDIDHAINCLYRNNGKIPVVKNGFYTPLNLNEDLQIQKSLNPNIYLINHKDNTPISVSNIDIFSLKGFIIKNIYNYQVSNLEIELQNSTNNAEVMVIIKNIKKKSPVQEKKIKTKNFRNRKHFN